MVADLNDLRAFIAYQVQEGFDAAHDIIENATHFAFEKLGREDLQPEIQRITAETLAAHQAELAGWEGLTDCDRLDVAFAALNCQGIVARQNFSCCNTCGFTEIWHEVEAEEERQPVEGYVFYHLQATESAIASGQLLMAYGCVEGDEATLSLVATKVVAELRRAGLNASWGGTADHPIEVDGMVWRRRR
jgi:hypothetical protein